MEAARTQQEVVQVSSRAEPGYRNKKRGVYSPGLLG